LCLRADHGKVGVFTAASGPEAAAGTKTKKGDNPMKSQILAVSTLLFVAAAPSHARPANQITIPFAFQVGDQTLPAGEYQVGRVNQHTTVAQLIRSTDSKSAVVILTIAAGSKNKYVPELVFHRYGHQYFLYQIWTGTGAGRELSPSKREKEAARGASVSEVAILFEPELARR
jgi:hypothetical protein